MSDLGIEYKEITKYDVDIYELINKLVKNNANIDDIAYSENNVKKGIQLLNLLLKNAVNINLRVIPQILKTI